MKKSCLALLLLAGFLAAAPGRAVICTIDDVPAATLLLPYFEVDLDEHVGRRHAVLGQQRLGDGGAGARRGVVGPVGAGARLQHLPDRLRRADDQPARRHPRHPAADRLGRAGPARHHLARRGSSRRTSTSRAATGCCRRRSCRPRSSTRLELSLTGQASPILGGRCAGRALGDNIARGYVTVDTVNNCTLRFPGDPGYFGPGGTGDATDQNVLWGDYFYINDGANFADGNTLVHIEASATNPETSTPGQYTFYGRYDGWTAVDNREPLATNFAARFVTGGLFDGGTSLFVWRDSKVNQTPFTCPVVAGSRPAWYPLGQEAIVIFDEAGAAAGAAELPGLAAAADAGADPVPGRGPAHRRSAAPTCRWPVQLRLALPQPQHHGDGGRREPAGGSGGGAGLGDGRDEGRRPVQRRLRRRQARQRLLGPPLLAGDAID